MTRLAALAFAVRLSRPRATGRRGFTLLEVLVAIAILGLGLTIILSAQAGLFSGSLHSSQLSVATGLARCKMSEVELELLQEGYPSLDESEEGPCCEDQTYPGFQCTWRIDHVELPVARETDLLGADGEESPDESSLGALGALANIGKTEGATLAGKEGISGVAELLGESQSESGAGLASMVMGFVYPQFKLMLEASIRRVAVTVTWKEGSQPKDLTVVQFVTNPTQGGLDPLAAEGLGDESALPGASPTPAVTPAGSSPK